MKFLFILFFTTLVAILNAQNLTSKTHANNLMFFKSFDCFFGDEAIKKYVYPNASCSAKIYSRKLSTLNFYLAFRRPIDKLYVSLRNI
jgi:hypothetical protein